MTGTCRTVPSFLSGCSASFISDYDGRQDNSRSGTGSIFYLVGYICKVIRYQESTGTVIMEAYRFLEKEEGSVRPLPPETERGPARTPSPGHGGQGRLNAR